MTLAQVKDAVHQASKLGSVNSIYIEGGEPFLYYPIMLALTRYASELGLDVGIVTNCYFATEVEDAVEWLRPLKDAGSIALSVSDDDYHSDADQTETPAKRAQTAAGIVGLDVGSICIEPPREVYDSKIPGEPILGGSVRFRGRAVEKLVNESLPRKSWDKFDMCPDEDFINIGRLHLDAYGNLFPCQGVVVGNLKKHSLSDIVERYDPVSHPVIAPLHRGGPAELVREYNLLLTDQYLDACHLCYLARKMLLNRFPDELAPPQVYGE